MERSAASWFDKAEAHLRAGELSHAIHGYERALELQPDFPAAKAQLKVANEQRDAGRWIVMRHDSYAREDTVIEECMTRATAEARVRELNALGEAHHWCTATT
jgi:Tfp pilus assembly protein PilF